MKELVYLTGQLKVREDKEKEFASIFNDLTKRLEKQKGCVSFKHYIHSEDKNKYSFIGTWKSEADARTSFQTDEFGLLFTAMDLLEKVPEISYTQVSNPDGLSLIRAWRKNHKS